MESTTLTTKKARKAIKYKNAQQQNKKKKKKRTENLQTPIELYYS